MKTREELPQPPFESVEEVNLAQEAAAELTPAEYRLLDGAPPPGACDCCSCNATRNHAECYASDEMCMCFEDPEFISCDPRVLCEHCGSCWCSVPDG